jgi:hypothetical protein
MAGCVRAWPCVTRAVCSCLVVRGRGADDVEGRDVFNEAPSKEDQLVAAQTETQKFIGKKAVLHTTKGDITIELFPTECPRTVENFRCGGTGCARRSPGDRWRSTWAVFSLEVIIAHALVWAGACVRVRMTAAH